MLNNNYNSKYLPNDVLKLIYVALTGRPGEFREEFRAITTDKQCHQTSTQNYNEKNQKYNKDDKQ